MKENKEKYLKIKQKVQSCYKSINKANKDLKFLRKVCDHPKSEIKESVDFMWRTASVVKADICGVCGEILETEFSKKFKL